MKKFIGWFLCITLVATGVTLIVAHNNETDPYHYWFWLILGFVVLYAGAKPRIEL